MKKYFLIWLISWLIIGVVAFFVWGQKEPGVMVGLALAATISLVLMIKTLLEQWSGVVIELKKERVTVRRGEHTDWREVLFAYVRLDNGKTKKIQPMPDWQIGDRLEKKRGDFKINVLKKKN